MISDKCYNLVAPQFGGWLLVNTARRHAEAAEEAHKEIERMPKGTERLMTWLSAMSRQLAKRGIEV